MPHTTVAIIGWSFAWLSALIVLRKRLGKQVDIKLFDERTHFCHIPALHDALLVPPRRLRQMQLSFAKRYPEEFIHDHITTIESNHLITRSGTKRTFEYCVIATGSRTNFFENKQREQYAYTVRYADDIPPLNKTLRNPKTKNITIIWWGYTGIEIASTIARRKRPDQHIRVVHSRERLFDRLSTYISKTAIGWLKRYDVEVVLNKKVSDIEPDTITLETGETLASDVTIVARWIRVNDESFSPHLTFHDNYQAADADHIFLCGDVAKHGLIATAHNAMFEGRRVGHLIANHRQGISKTYSPLQNRDKLAIALWPHDGIFTNGVKWIYIPRLIGIAKRIIEWRVLFEFSTRVLLWI